MEDRTVERKEMKANRLLKEQSPYLRQHAYNPVDWYPWGEEAFRRSKDEDRPIFLSIGYSSCHWCPEWHVRAVFQMLALQGRRAEFTGGLEAAVLEDYHVGLLADLKPRPACFFAYDPGDPFETLKSAADRMLAAGFTRESHRMRVYVLIGYPKDTFAAAEQRLQSMVDIGFTPHAMLWQPETPSAEKWRPSPEWSRFQRVWLRPAIVHRKRGAA